VSRHLGLLKDASLVAEQRTGGFTYYTLSRELQDGSLRPLWTMLEAQFHNGGSGSATRADDARLQEVLRVRQENFDTHGEAGRQLVPGRSWAAWARALGLLLPPLTVADIACGEGYLTIEAARWAKRVIAVDQSREVLARARALARRRRVTNIVWKRGAIEKLPIRDAAVDVSLLSQALHHATDPAAALREAVRVVVPGGRVLVLDLRTHGEVWVRSRLGDKQLGFADEQLARMLSDSGLRDVRVRVGARRTGDPFTVLIASGVKGGRARGIRRQ
jgi:ArsR family transcriptional regulator